MVLCTPQLYYSIKYVSLGEMEFEGRVEAERNGLVGWRIDKLLKQFRTSYCRRDIFRKWDRLQRDHWYMWSSTRKTNCTNHKFRFTSSTPEFSSSSSSVDHSQPLHRESLRPSGDASIVPLPDVSLFLTTKFINGVSRSVVFPGSENPCSSSSFSTRGGTSAFPIPSTLVDSETGGGRLRHVSNTDQLKFRCLRLGRLSGCVRNCRGIRSQLRKSDARPVMYRSTEPDHLQFQRKRRHRSCCHVLLFSSSSTQDVGVVIFFPHMKMGYCSSPLQQDDCTVAMWSWSSSAVGALSWTLLYTYVIWLQHT